MLTMRIAVALAFCIFFIDVCAQDQMVADSLKNVYLSKQYSDTSELSVLEGIAFHETNPSESEVYADLLIEKAKALKDYENELRGWLQKGNAQQLRGDYDLAFESFFIALDRAIKSDNDKGIGISYSLIADAHSLTGDSENAIIYYKKGIGILRSIPDSLSLATTLLNAGDEYFNSDNLDSALLYFEESGIIYDRLDYEIGQAYNLGNVGLVYAKQGLHNQAEAKLDEASEILERLGDIYPIAEYNFYLADIYEQRNEISRAISYAEFGYNIGQYYNLKKQLHDGAELLSSLYEASGDNGKALMYLKECMALKDSLNSTTVIREMADLQREFEVAQKQAEVDLLNQQKRTQQVVGLALIIILVFAVVVLISLYQISRRRKRLNLELELVNETKNKFFSIISHDLKSPISAFYGLSRMIKTYIERKEFQNLNRMTDHIDRSVQSISSLLDNLLTWALQQQGPFPYQPETLNLREMVEDVCSILSPIAESKHIAVEANISKDIEVWVDRNSAMTIVRNLISNALKFTPEGGHILIMGRKREEMAQITIEDTGIGMSEDQLHSLFSFTGEKSTYGTSGEKGVGLGLQLVYEFIKLNKGTIEVESEKGKGTVFSITLPVATSTTLATVQATAEPVAS